MKTRKDYVELDYLNGVKNENGEQVIRALTQEERDWIQRFYQETEHVNFQKTKQIQQEREDYKQLKKEYKELKDKFSREAAELKSKIETKYKSIVELREQTGTFYTEDKDRQALFDRDYERRMDLFNNAKSSGNLIYYDSNEYDKFESESEKDVNAEDLLMEHLTEPIKKRTTRTKKRKSLGPKH